MDNAVSHDQITRFLSSSDFGSPELWLLVKPTVRATESEDGVLIIDDTIQEKPWTDENEIITWHFDHSKNRAVKGVNILNCLYHVQGASIPVASEIIRKTIRFYDPKTHREKRKSEVTKNELMRDMLKTCQRNQLAYKYVLTDNWFASRENMDFIKLDLKKDFIMALKTNRKVALSLEDKHQGRFVRVDSLELELNTAQSVYIKGVEFPLVLTRQVFKNKDGSNGVLYLVSSDTNLTYDQVTTIYQKRWEVELFHKSVKSNASLAKSPTRTVRTQSNHFFASIYAFFKLEQLKLKHKLNHFALRTKLYMEALKSSFTELQKLSA
ncbi:MAG: hypothetical protein DDT30_01345 [Dehalococcoidia bacterium]|nr:hypothetical protein [Bacillota bacterium]